jgi:hypothetical protein
VSTCLPFKNSVKVTVTLKGLPGFESHHWQQIFLRLKGAAATPQRKHERKKPTINFMNASSASLNMAQSIYHLQLSGAISWPPCRKDRNNDQTDCCTNNHLVSPDTRIVSGTGSTVLGGTQGISRLFTTVDTANARTTPSNRAQNPNNAPFCNE